ncbi:MAG: aldehyde ferredoxin oxidoreductase C-terminal domain-containing protein [Bacillota bacterium]
MDRILRVDMSTGQVTVEPLPDRWRPYGGRALTSRIVWEEVDPGCDPLGPNNKLVWAPGLLSGTTVSSSSRISVGCKSPLTGGIKEANAGGETGLYLAQAGYRAVIVSGAAPPGQWYVLVVDREGGRLEPAPPEILGAGNYAAAPVLFARYGRSAAIALLGPAGEQRMRIAGIANTDKEGRPARMNARGGVGAVMGAKGLKAIVVLGDRKHPVPARDPEGWQAGARRYHRALREHPSTADFYPNLGTPGVLEKVNKLGGLPTRNFSSGRFELADAISGVALRELILARGGAGATTHACMTGCAIRCSNIFPDAQGRELASAMEFETNCLLGANLGIGDLDAIARFTRLCNDLGVDTIETGAAIGVAMEAGLLAWGDAAAVERLLDVEVRRGTPLGRIIGAGAASAGEVLGVRRVPVVKRQAISAYDPRVIKGNGVTYATSPMGADHTAGNTIGYAGDHLDPRDKVAVSREMQIKAGLLDILGFCNFARGILDTDPESFVVLYNARMGTDLTYRDLRRLALEMIRMEVAFNRRAGLGPETDRLPEWMRTEPLPPHQSVFDVPEEELDRIWEGAE